MIGENNQKSTVDVLTKQEYAHLAGKIKDNAIPASYYRQSLFVPSARSDDSKDLKRKKIVYHDAKMTIKVDRELNQLHRDLFSLLPYESHTKPDKTGRYYIHTSLYKLAKQMGYKYPDRQGYKIKDLLEDMQKTLLNVSIKGGGGVSHTLIGAIYRNTDEDGYIIEIPAETAKFWINSTCVALPQEINEKIVKMPRKYARIKALASYLHSHKPTQNGLHFDTICEKLDIKNSEKSNAKSKFKKQVQDNVEMLKELGINYDANSHKFFVDDGGAKFYLPLSKHQIEGFKNNQKPTINSAKKLSISKINNRGEQVKVPCRVVDFVKTDHNKWYPILKDENGNIIEIKNDQRTVAEWNKLMS